MPADRAPSILITGIHSESGLTISHRFRNGGWFVIGCDQGVMTGRNARVHVTADLTNEADCRRAVKQAASLGNGLDCIVNNADIRLDGPVDEIDTRAWDVMMDVNAKSMFMLATAGMPFLAQEHGTIVAVAPSPSDDDRVEHAVFDASRAAVIALMGSLATELAPRGVGVHVVMPDDDARVLTAEEIAGRVWDVASVDEHGHERSFAHSH